MQEEIHVIIKGRVQMVMYRDFVQRTARWFGLTGTVKNLSDGTVEVVAQGSREKLEALIERLHKGSLFSRVDAVEVVWQKPQKSFTGFHIIY